jgi:transketolase
MTTSFEVSKTIRAAILKMVHNSGGAHIASALSIVDIVTVLYNDILKFDPYIPDWEKRDRFILSKGHACTPIYALLAQFGFFSWDDLKFYGQDSSNLMNHISHKVLGVEFSTGALGHGLPFGVGKAMAAKILNQNWRTFVLLSDGELDEGSNWEAFMFASHHRLNNLTAIIDYNKLQSLGTVEKTIGLEPLNDKFKSFGWDVIEIDGHDYDQIAQSLNDITNVNPKVIIAHTIKGKGVSFMENKVEWHYKTPNKDELELALSELN